MSHSSPRWGYTTSFLPGACWALGQHCCCWWSMHTPHAWSCARVDHCGQDRKSVRPTLLHHTSSSEEGTLRSHTDWSAGGVIAKTLQDEATLCQLGTPFYPGSWVLHPGVNSGQCSTAARTLQSDPSVLGCLATVRAVEQVQGGLNHQIPC